MKVRIDTQVYLKRGSFKYLCRYIIQEIGEIDENVAYYIGVGWMKKNVLSSRLDGTFDRVVVRLIMLYGWSV